MKNIIQINNKNLWENFFKKQPKKSFLHSWNWGRFNQLMGNKIWRIGILDKDELTGIALVIKNQAKRGTFLLCPHGPYLNWEKKEDFQHLINYIKDIAHKENCAFIRIAPFIERNNANHLLFSQHNFIYSPIHTHAEYTWNLDLKLSQEELLKNMRKTTRYCIRKAEKEGVKIIKTKNINDLQHYLTLQEETRKRHHFTPFSENYLRNEFISFLDDDQIVLFLAEYQKKIIAAGIFIYWQNISFYHHGASSSKYPKIPAAYLLQWEAIKEAKKRNCLIHNFWGIAEEDKPNHPWQGITLFKKGFGGYGEKLLQSHDLPLKPNYWLTYLFEKLRKKWRGF